MNRLGDRKKEQVRRERGGRVRRRVDGKDGEHKQRLSSQLGGTLGESETISSGRKGIPMCGESTTWQV